MARKVIFINLLLLAAVLAISYHLVGAWAAFEAEQNLGKVLAAAEQHVGTTQEAPVGGKIEPPNLPDLLVIAERDLFRPERRAPSPEPEDKAVVEAPKFPKRPQMQGASQVGEEQRALLTVFDTPKSQGETRQVALGDQVQGYSVTDITATTVTLQWNEVKEIIDMFDNEAAGGPQPQTQARKGASVNIVRIGRKYAAVETSSPEAAQEDKGVQAAAAPGPAGNTARRAIPDRRGNVRPTAPSGTAMQVPRGVVGVPRPAAPPTTPEPENP